MGLLVVAAATWWMVQPGRGDAIAASTRTVTVADASHGLPPMPEPAVAPTVPTDPIAEPTPARETHGAPHSDAEPAGSLDAISPRAGMPGATPLAAGSATRSRVEKPAPAIVAKPNDSGVSIPPAPPPDSRPVAAHPSTVETQTVALSTVTTSMPIVPGPSSASEACGRLPVGARASCMRRECGQGAFGSRSDCLRFLEMDRRHDLDP
jgi:hypothetical protein